MNRIECYSNWCWIDRLDGVDLKHGERLLVRFPDGHELPIECVIEQKTVPISDHGSRFDATSSRAFAEIYFHGVPCKLPLVGLEARRV